MIGYGRSSRLNNSQITVTFRLKFFPNFSCCPSFYLSLVTDPLLCFNSYSVGERVRLAIECRSTLSLCFMYSIGGRLSE